MVVDTAIVVQNTAPVNTLFSAGFCVFGVRLKEERERLGLSQPAFGEIAGAAKRTVIDWEKGVSSPTGFQLEALAAAGTDVHYIVTGTRKGPPPLKPDEQTLLDGYRSLDAATKRRMLAFVLGGDSPASEKYSGNKIGQVIQGDYTSQGDNLFKFGGKKKK